MSRNPRQILLDAYTAAQNADQPEPLSAEQTEWVQAVADAAESQKAVLAATITSLVKKSETPAQDVRLHKTIMPGGYSGRSYDTSHVTSFLAEEGHFPRLAMKSGSGWLTRSIEQDHPFTLDFPGRIQVAQVKNAFLQILNDVQEKGQAPEPYLRALFGALLRRAEAAVIVFAPLPKERRVTVQAVTNGLESHFFYRYAGAGASRLPVLALYALYELLMETNPRYKDKRLLPLKSHTTSDLKSASIGDIEIADTDGAFFEAVEVKHEIAINARLVTDAFNKFAPLPVHRYYLLTTANPNVTDLDEVNQIVARVAREHGCEIIVNGLLPTLKYYLRLLDDPAAFIAGYTALLERDFAAGADIKETHLRRWNEILTELNASAEPPAEERPNA